MAETNPKPGSPSAGRLPMPMAWSEITHTTTSGNQILFITYKVTLFPFFQQIPSRCEFSHE
jgi:hypothetical protein